MNKCLCCRQPATIKLWNKHIPYNQKRGQSKKFGYFCKKHVKLHTTKFDNWINADCPTCIHFDTLTCWDCHNGSIYKTKVI